MFTFVIHITFMYASAYMCVCSGGEYNRRNVGG